VTRFRGFLGHRYALAFVQAPRVIAEHPGPSRG
jgi:hypothetical protein